MGLVSKNLLLHHCLLNMNVRAPGIAIWEGVLKPVFDILKREDVWFMQLPCPEASYLGLRRWWFVKEQYDNAMFRKFCRKLAICVREILKENGIVQPKLVGLGLSPSCAYREVQSDPSWGGRPFEVDITKNLRPGMGIWSEELLNALEELRPEHYDISPAMIYPRGRAEHARLYPKTIEGALKEFSWELGVSIESLPVEEYKVRESAEEDLRLGRNLVAPLEMALERDEMIIDYAERGYGLILIPRSDTWDGLREFYLEAISDQVKNQLAAGQTVSIVKSYEGYSEMYGKFLGMMRGVKGLESV